MLHNRQEGFVGFSSVFTFSSSTVAPSSPVSGVTSAGIVSSASVSSVVVGGLLPSRNAAVSNAAASIASIAFSGSISGSSVLVDSLDFELASLVAIGSESKFSTSTSLDGSSTLFPVVAVSEESPEAVSYTHLTLPTIYSV